MFFVGFIKLSVVGTHFNTSTHIICFDGKIRKQITEFSAIYLFYSRVQAFKFLTVLLSKHNNKQVFINIKQVFLHQSVNCLTFPCSSSFLIHITVICRAVSRACWRIFRCCWGVGWG